VSKTSYEMLGGNYGKDRKPNGDPFSGWCLLALIIIMFFYLL